MESWGGREENASGTAIICNKQTMFCCMGHDWKHVSENPHSKSLTEDQSDWFMRGLNVLVPTMFHATLMSQQIMPFASLLLHPAPICVGHALYHM